MKNIFIMCNGRTGSSFLSGHFPSVDMKPSVSQYNAWEFFAMWPPNFWRNIHFIRRNNINMPDSFIDYMSNIFSCKRDKLGQQAQMNDFPYTINMLPDFANAIKSLKLDYFLHKNISHANAKGGWSQEDVMKHADVVIVNYRRSILDTYISNVKASESRLWLTHNYNEKYDDKIYWSKKAFLEYAEKYKRQYADIRKTLHKLNKPYIVIEYETLCRQSNRIQYLSDKLKTVGITDLELINANTVKQSKHRDHYERCFKKYHVNQFIEDYPSIKHETTYKF